MAQTDIKWTNEQLEAINTRGKNLLVAAAAGSGKTAVLVERIRTLVSDEMVPIRDFLVVTFTNAAAAEMKDKLRRAISQELLYEKDDKKAKYLRQQLIDLETANISTFHAFGLSVIRRFFYKIDIEPGFGVADETETGIMMEQAMDDLLDSRFQEFSQDFVEFMDAYSGDRNSNSVRILIAQAYAKLRTLPDGWTWMQEQIREENLEIENFARGPIWAAMRQDIYTKVGTALDNYIAATNILDDGGFGGFADKIRANEIEACARVLSLLEAGGRSLSDPKKCLKEIRELLSYKSTQIRVPKEDQESYQPIREQIGPYREKARDTLRDAVISKYLKLDIEDQLGFSRDTLSYLETLLSLVREFHERYGDLKAQEQVIDFDDIEHYCYEILMDPEVAEYYRKNISQIFIDEYQDTNLMQEAIINKIKRDNNLFMVGDIKQSIYRFRLAEPTIFQDKYLDYRFGEDENNLAIDLNRNHRSKAGIIEYINTIFEALMEGYDDRAKLYCGVECAEDYEFDPELKVVLPVDSERIEELSDPDLYDQDMIEDLDELEEGLMLDEELTDTEREAHYVAKLIKENLGKPVFDNKMDPPTERPLEYRDIVVLRRSVRDSASVFQDIFKKEGIPSQIQGDDGYFDAMEIETFVDLLTIIDNSNRDVPFIGVLHSEIFGYSAEDLARIRLGHKEGSYVQAFKAVAEEDTDIGRRAAGVLETLAKWRNQSRTMTLPRFLWNLLMESGCYALMGALPNGSRRQANLRALCDMAERFAKGKQGTLYDFLFYVESIKKGNIKMPEARDNSTGQDVVRIMTIHKSKGLEFPMVIVSGLGRIIRKGPKSAFSMHKDIGVGLPLVNRKGLWSRKTLLQNLINSKDEDEDLKEEIRILYVALTRAKDKLFLVAHQRDDRFVTDGEAGFMGYKSFLNMIVPMVPYTMENLSLADMLGEEDASDTSAYKKWAERSKALLAEVPDDVRDRILEQLNYVYPHEAARNLKSKYSVSELNREAIDGRVERRKRPAYGSKSEFTAAERGTIYHRIMEKMDFGSCVDKDRAEILGMAELTAQAMIEDHLLMPEELEAVDLGQVAGFFGTDIGQRAAEAHARGELEKERPFTLKMQKDGEDILVQGIIDCYFTDGDRTVLIDYKSNWVDPRLSLDEEKARLAREYKAQIEIYRDALNKAGKSPVEEAYLYLFGPGDFVPM